MTNLVKIGNSRGIRIPKTLIEQVHLEGKELKLTVIDGGIFISPVLGNPPDIDQLVEIADNNGIKLILDNCDSLGSHWRGIFPAFAARKYPRCLGRLGHGDTA